MSTTISDFLKLVYAPDSPIDLDRSKIISDQFTCAGDLKLPVFGELLGIETDALVRINRYARKLALQFSLAAQRVQREIGCTRQDGAVALVDALMHGGIYTASKPSGVSPFDSTKVENYERIVTLTGLYVYDPETLIGVNEETELRYLAYDSSESWDLVGVQGETVGAQVANILLKTGFKRPATVEFIDLQTVLKGDDPVYTLLKQYEYGQSADLMLDLLLYVRCGVDQKISKYLPQSTITKIRDAVNLEMGIKPQIAPNPNNPDVPAEVGEGDEDAGK